MGGAVENKAMGIRLDNDGAPAIRVKKKPVGHISQPNTLTLTT